MPRVPSAAKPDTLSPMTDYLKKRRDRVAAAWKLEREIVLIGAGEPISVPGGADQVYPFLSHSEYFYLSDRETPGGVLAFDPQSGWTDFVPPVSEAERVWEGRTDAPGSPIHELAGWLAARRGRPTVNLGCLLPGILGDPGRMLDLRETLMHARRPKDSVELERMRRAATATAAGFETAQRMIQAGVTERAVQIELEAAFLRHGGDTTAYGTIVGAGSNSAVLHFTPSTRVLREGDSVLIDAGAMVQRYACDVTRTYRAPGGDPGFFRELYALVLGVNERAVARCVPGMEWRDVHMKSATEIAAGLVDLGILRGHPEELVERDAHALFYPHGLGHMVGLGVRDASGYLPGRVRSTRPGLGMLRTDLPLQLDYVITVEPGVYFIPALLDNPERRAEHRDTIVWSRVDELKEFGGIRIEDNVRVRRDEPEVLTAGVPRSLEAVLA
jgi:Xaa-Pro aminopeptidase